MSNFILTQDQLAQILIGNANVSNWYDALSQILPNYDINSVNRVAAFLAQCGHESGGFNTLKENLNYKAESLMRVWPRYFPTEDIANQYAHNQEAIANRAYAGRLGNGDEASGDGWKFCGRGLIQLTGRSNYQAFANSIQMNIDDTPAYLATFEGAVQGACWFWHTHNLNALADVEELTKMTEAINGGTLGLDDRITRYNQAKQIIGA